MPCYTPLDAYRGRAPDGSSAVFFKHPGGDPQLIRIACGQCLGCRLERSRQWAIRCMHEASLYERNCFLTLTYSNEALPPGASLVRRDLQLFLKRMRKHVVKRQLRSFRFFGCGEYGDQTARPHYHLIIFDFDFSDKELWRRTAVGHRVYRSAELERLWSLGSCEIGDVSFESAAYVARYCVKKVTGAAAAAHYERLDPDGRVYSVLPEFPAFSNRPGIGAPWLARFHADVFPDDFVVVRGRKMRPPKAYDRFLEKLDASEFEVVHDARGPATVADAVRAISESSDERLRVKEEVASSRMATFSGRSL